MLEAHSPAMFVSARVVVNAAREWIDNFQLIIANETQVEQIGSLGVEVGYKSGGGRAKRF